MTQKPKDASCAKASVIPKTAVLAAVMHNGNGLHTIAFLRDRYTRGDFTEEGCINLQAEKEIASAIHLSRECLYELCVVIREHLKTVELAEANNPPLKDDLDPVKN